MRFATAGGERAFRPSAKSEAEPSEGWEMSCQPREPRRTRRRLLVAGSPGELGFLSGREALLLQETAQLATIKVKGAARKQKGVALNWVCRDCPWMSAADSGLRNQQCLPGSPGEG